MAAARFADVGTGDPHPLVLGRRVEHPLEQLAIASLELLALGQRSSGPGNSLGQRIAHPLELVQPGYPRLGEAAWNLGIDLESRKRLGPQPCQLVLKPADLTPKLGTRKPLIASNSKRSERLVFKHLRHEPNRV